MKRDTFHTSKTMAVLAVLAAVAVMVIPTNVHAQTCINGQCSQYAIQPANHTAAGFTAIRPIPDPQFSPVRLPQTMSGHPLAGQRVVLSNVHQCQPSACPPMYSTSCSPPICYQPPCAMPCRSAWIPPGHSAIQGQRFRGIAFRVGWSDRVNVAANYCRH